MRSEDVALLLAAAAVAIGVVLAVVLWRRRRRRRRIHRSQHPAARPLVQVSFDDAAQQVRVSVPPGAPEISVDIVSFRRADAAGPWEAASFDDAVVLPSGGHAWFGSGSSADSPDGATPPTGNSVPVDVVVAWTARHPAGEVPGSRLFRLPPERDEPIAASPGGVTGPAAVGLVALLVGSGVLVAVSIGDDEPDRPPPATVESDADEDPSSAPTTGVATTSAATTTVSASGAPTIATVETASTTAVPTAPADTTTTSTPNRPVVAATGRIEPCRFGDECLVVGFTIAGFETSPADYVCEFDDGSRFAFGFVGDGAETACSTGDATAEIVVEVAGVRSEPVTRP